MVLNSKRFLPLLLLLIAAGLPGCGGHSKSSNGSNTGGATGPGGTQSGDTSMSAAALHAVMDAADAEFSTVVNGTTDHDARNTQMAAWLKTRPEFAASGVTPNVDGVWGRLKNGQLYVATSSFIPGEDGAAPQVRTTPSAAPAPDPAPSARKARSLPARDGSANELPQSSQAHVLLSLDKEFYGPPNDAIASTLRDYHYTVLQQTATVANLKAIQGDGAFFWGTHGDVGVDDRNVVTYWSAWTADDVTDAANVANKPDLDDGSLVYFTAAYRRNPEGTGTLCKTHYAITKKFIKKYNWSFAPHAFVFMDCCYSHVGGMTSDLIARPGKADQAFGWSNSVGVNAAWKAGAFAFDRLLGANRAEPLESVPQRPFDADNVFNEMGSKGLANGSVNGNTCTLVNIGPGSPCLAPAIDTMEMSERIQESPQRGKSKLTLHGQFGSEKGTVKIGGVEVPITTWAADKIECEPADAPGPGFAGDVLVLSEDRPGNSVPLTQWHGQLKYDIDILPPIVSNAHAQITCDVYFRGDVHRHRNQAGEGLNSPVAFDFRAAPGSTAHWKVTGDPLPTAAWSLPIEADLPFGLNGTVDPPFGTGFIVSGNMDEAVGKVKFSFGYLGCVTQYDFPGTPNPPQDVVTLHDPLLTTMGSGVGSDGYPIYANNLAGTIDTSTFVVASADFTGSTPVYEPKLTWTAFTPTFMPDESKGEDDGH